MLPVEFEEATILRGPFVASFSDEEFFRFCQENDLMRVERTATQEIIIMPPVGGESSRLSGNAYFQLTLWSQRNGGYTFESSAGFRLADGAILSPDASWVRPEKWDQLSPKQRSKFLPFCPDVIIEIKSPSDRIKTLQAKMKQWLTNGVELGFLLDKETKIAYIYRPGQPVEIIQGFDHQLSGELVMPGFQLDLRNLA